MKKYDEMGTKVLEIVALIGVLVLVVIAAIPYNKPEEHIITDQELAEWVVEYESNGRYENVTKVEIESYENEGEWINCYVYCEGQLKAYRGFDRDYYLYLMEREDG